MNRYFRVLIFGLAGMVISGGGPGAQPVIEHGLDWPDWAYGLLSPMTDGDRVAPPCPTSAKPIECAYIGDEPPEDGIKRSLPDTDATFTRNEAYFGYGPADWYRDDHPPMTSVIANGRQPDGLRACAL